MSEITTEAGKRLLAVMGRIPPDGKKGLAWFIAAIEAEARDQVTTSGRLATYLREQAVAAERARLSPLLDAARAVVDQLADPSRPIAVDDGLRRALADLEEAVWRMDRTGS